MNKVEVMFIMLMVGESGTARNKNTYRYYKCLSAKRKRGCDKKAVKKDWIENLVINQIVRVIWDDNLIEDITDLVMDMQKNENNVLPLLRKRQNEINKGISNLFELHSAKRTQNDVAFRQMKYG